jgi:uncharacterized Zn finger protein (UPF0148 family)
MMGRSDEHTCPKCKMSLVRDLDRSDRLICPNCWAVRCKSVHVLTIASVTMNISKNVQ